MYFQKLLAYAAPHTLHYDSATGLVTRDSTTEPLRAFVRTLFYECGDHVQPEDFEEELFEERLLHDQVTEKDLSDIRTCLEKNNDIM